MTIREQFEAWVLNDYPNQQMGKFANDEYHSTTVQFCWLAWQASRAALVIALPETFEKRDVQGLDYDKTVAAIEAAGVRVKA